MQNGKSRGEYCFCVPLRRDLNRERATCLRVRRKAKKQYGVLFCGYGRHRAKTPPFIVVIKRYKVGFDGGANCGSNFSAKSDSI